MGFGVKFRVRGMSLEAGTEVSIYLKLGGGALRGRLFHLILLN